MTADEVKHMGIFSSDNPVIQWLDTFVDHLLLQLLTLVFSLPVVTIGAAEAAKYYTAQKLARKETVHVLGTFIRGFKANFKQGLFLEIVAAVALAILAVDWFIVVSFDFGLISYGLLSVVAVVTLMVWIILTYAFPLLARYHASLWGVLKSAFAIGLGKFGTSVLMVLCDAAILVGCYIWILYAVFIWLIGGTLVLMAKSWLLTRVFDSLTITSEDN